MKFSCKHCGDGVNTWERFCGHIWHWVSCYYVEVSPLYNVLWECFCCCLQVNYIFYKHFDRLLHVGSFDPTCVQNFRSVPLTV